jgi:hypothetical protein
MAHFQFQSPYIFCGLSHEEVTLDPTFGSIGAEGFSISTDGQRLSGTYFNGMPINHSGPFHAFIRTFGGFFPPWWFSWAFASADFGEAMSGRAINDENDRAGFFREGNNLVPFVWWGNAPKPVRFDLKGAQLQADLTSGVIPNAAFAINNVGFVAGAYTGTNGMMVGFVTDGHAANAQKAFTTVNCAGLNATLVLIRGLNSAREIVGRFDNQDDTFGFVSFDVAGNYNACTPIAFSPTATLTVVGGINDSRQIVGHYTDDAKKQNLHGFFGRVDAMGQAQGMMTVDYPGADKTRLNAISNNGDMLGTAYFGTTFFPFVCRYGCHRIAPFTEWGGMVQAVSAGVALGGSGWVRPYDGPPHPEPTPWPFEFSSSSPAERAALALAIYKTLEGADDALLGQSRQSLLEYVRKQIPLLK